MWTITSIIACLFPLRYFWRLKWLFRIAVIFFQLIGNVNKKSHAKFQVDTTKLYRDIGERIFVSRADLAGKVRRHTAPKTLSSCFGIPQGWSRWQIAGIKPCHPIQMTLFDHGGGSINTRVGDSFQRERVNKFPCYSEDYFSLKFVILVWLTNNKLSNRQNSGERQVYVYCYLLWLDC